MRKELEKIDNEISKLNKMVNNASGEISEDWLNVMAQYRKIIMMQMLLIEE